MPWGEKSIACRNLTSLPGSQRTLYNINGSCYNSHQMLLNALNKSGRVANHAQAILSQIRLQIINFQFLQITTFCTYTPDQNMKHLLLLAPLHLLHLHKPLIQICQDLSYLNHSAKLLFILNTETLVSWMDVNDRDFHLQWHPTHSSKVRSLHLSFASLHDFLESFWWIHNRHFHIHHYRCNCYPIKQNNQWPCSIPWNIQEPTGCKRLL